MTSDALTLQGRRIAVPESRQLDLFADMLEKRGASVLRCPLVSIHDSPDTKTVNAWLDQCIAGEFDDLILMTGEGLRRLLGFAERTGRQDSFVHALADIRKLTRGPKPERALRDIGLRSDLKAETPTSEGLIETLEGLHLDGRSVGLQLYPDPSPLVQEYLQNQGASVFPVFPYIYADDAEDQAVSDLIDQICGGALDAIAFTSSPQIRRLFSLAQSSNNEDALMEGLARLSVSAVGPVVAEALQSRGVRVNIQPDESFFMKPLVTELCRQLGPAS